MSKFVLHLVHFRWSLEVVKRVSHDQVHHLYTKILERSRMFWKIPEFFTFFLKQTSQTCKLAKY